MLGKPDGAVCKFGLSPLKIEEQYLSICKSTYGCCLLHLDTPQQCFTIRIELSIACLLPHMHTEQISPMRESDV